MSRAPSQIPHPARPLVLAVAAVALLTLAGSLGYVWVEDLSFADALYMTVITLSTVGYREVSPLSPAGRWFTVALIMVGVGTVFYSVVALAQFMIEGRLRDLLERRHMHHTIDAVRDHVIVCGFGRLGTAVAQMLKSSGAVVVVVDVDASREAACLADGHLFVNGSALDDTVLRRAGIERARAVVAATNSDSDNVFITLQAHDVNPEAKVHARAVTEAGIRRLRLAGASQVISPHHLGGQRIANAIMRPSVVEFLELSTPGSGPEIDLEEVAVDEGSRLARVALGDLPRRGVQVSVVALKRGSGPLRLRPGADDVLEPGDRVIVVGDHESLRRLGDLAKTRS